MKISTSLVHAMKVDGASARGSARMMKQAGFDGVDLALCHDMLDFEKRIWLRRLREACRIGRNRRTISEIFQKYIPVVAAYRLRRPDFTIFRALCNKRRRG